MKKKKSTAGAYRHRGGYIVRQRDKGDPVAHAHHVWCAWAPWLSHYSQFSTGAKKCRRWGAVPQFHWEIISGRGC